MIPRQPQDPFTDSTSSTTRNNPTSTSLRSAASTASSRPRQPPRPGLLNPTRTRRPNSRTTPRIEDDIHEDDPDPLQQHHAHPQAPKQTIAQNKRAATRTGSPTETRRTKSRNSRVSEEQEFVNRQEDGSYILRLAGYGGVASTAGMVELGEQQGEGEDGKQDAEFAKYAREYFTVGTPAALKGRVHKTSGDFYDQLNLPMMARLREQAITKIEGERWFYESVDRVQGGYR